MANGGVRAGVLAFPPASISAGWKTPVAVCFGAGLISALGFEPVALVPAFVGGTAVFLAMLRGVSWRHGAVLGLAYGIGQNLVSFAWLIDCIHDFGGFSWTATGIVYGFIAFEVALYLALFGALIAVLAKGPGAFLAVAPFLWCAAEWLRTGMFSWGWNLSGYVFADWPVALQLADLGGVYMLSWLVVLLSAGLAVSLEMPFRALAALGVVVVGVTGYGHYRLSQSEASPEPSLAIGMVQGNIAQARKWDPAYRDDILRTFFELTAELSGDVDLVVWPEAAIPLFLQKSPETRAAMAALSRRVGAPVLTGADTVRPGDDGGWRYFNSMLLLDGADALDRRYDKHHLIAFGEYLPLRAWLPDGVGKLTVGHEDVTPGPGPATLDWGKAVLGPLICFEVIFPGEVRALAAAGARVLVNATNDAWFGESIKPQHLAMSRVRAVENRLPLIRVANTGISAAYDAWGREVVRIAPNHRGTARAMVAPGPGGSPFAWFGPLWVVLCFLGPAVAVAARFREVAR